MNPRFLEGIFMRYISIPYLQEGMVLAQPIYGGKLEILLAQGMALGRPHIQRINDLGYPGVYIRDGQYLDIEARDIIPAELRLRTIKAAKEILTLAERGAIHKSGVKVSGKTNYKIIDPVINAIISNKERRHDFIDIKPFDNYPYYHSANVTVLSLLIGVELGLSGNQLYELGLAALFHDVGNAFIPKEILKKPGALANSEYETVKRHTEIGFEFLRGYFDIPIEACVGALQHHENYDGTGYPNMLKEKKISVYGRIISVAGVYDALMSRRPFRPFMFPPEALGHIKLNAGTMFDPDIVNGLLRVVAIYPAGTCVELNTGVCCLVVKNYADSPARPRLRLLDKKSRTPMYIDLYGNPVFADIKIARLVEEGHISANVLS